MSRQLFVVNIVGLTPSLIGDHSPFLNKILNDNHSAEIAPVVPAVTCSSQYTYLTGEWPSKHGIVGNGWYFKDLDEVMFWRQSSNLVRSEKIWDHLKFKDPSLTTSQMFWWYNMYASADYSVTPRPMYPADGRKIPDCYAQPMSLRDELTEKLGPFPLFKFWGPMTDISSSQWIADATIYVNKKYKPNLNLVYLPHLDYNLQRLGPNHPNIKLDVAEIDKVVSELWNQVEGPDVELMILSEYGISEVDKPVHLNRLFRDKGWIQIKKELGLEYLDAGASEVFAVADHQVAHVYVKDKSKVREVKQLVESVEGVETVYDKTEQSSIHIDHERSGDLFAVSNKNAWFTYYFWHDDNLAPDFARTVDIHRKPGYDPVELFVDPEIQFPKLKLALKLLKKKLGFRCLMDVISLDATLVKGSHGRAHDNPNEGPVLLTSFDHPKSGSQISPTAIKDLILSQF